MGKKGQDQEKPERLSIDLKGRRSKVEKYRSDSVWKDLPITAKIRAMIDDAYTYLHGDKRLDDNPPSIAQLVSDHWQALTDAGLDMSGRRLKEIREGSKPSDGEILDLAMVLPYNTEHLMEIRARDFKNGHTNGKPATNKV